MSPERSSAKRLPENLPPPTFHLPPAMHRLNPLFDSWLAPLAVIDRGLALLAFGALTGLVVLLTFRVASDPVLVAHRRNRAMARLLEVWLRRQDPVGSLLALLHVFRLVAVQRWLGRRRGVRVLHVHYEEALSAPDAVAAAVARFLRRGLDVPAMAATVEQGLYRNRAT